ncbi:MAG TPA: FliM/FliN family flagellar motor switch protein [Candidatus Hydrogenedentes bacterium]|nr:FliM/FliN family flagellar motor switch protein [Candidatus Hydrogenedentota bacterium]HRK33334.1 FliM/FliN family flagellar motor switch protein [Candidatus Hydrogenedentota bacterium]
MAEPHTPEEHTFEEIVPASGPPASHLKLDDLKRVKLVVSADLGSCNMLVREVLELQRGSVVQLSKLAGEMTDIYVNGQSLARGEVVVIGDTLHVRIGELVGQEHKNEGYDVTE